MSQADYVEIMIVDNGVHSRKLIQVEKFEATKAVLLSNDPNLDIHRGVNTFTLTTNDAIEFNKINTDDKTSKEERSLRIKKWFSNKPHVTDLCFDFDGVNADAESNLVFDILRNSGINKNTISFNESLNGAHIRVSHEVFGLEPSVNNCWVVKRIVGGLINRVPLTSVDLHIYNLRGMMREPNIVHPKSGKITASINDAVKKPNICWDLFKAAQLVIDSVNLPITNQTKLYNGLIIGEHPPCVKRILGGVVEGERNNALFVLSVYWKNRGLNNKQVTEMMITWNNLNNPPLRPAELNATIRSALDSGIAFGCKGEGSFSTILRGYCTSDCTINRQLSNGSWLGKFHSLGGSV